MKTNVSIHLDAEMTEFLRKEAEKRGVSLEEYIDQLVQACIRKALEYEKARVGFMECLRNPLNPKLAFEGGRPPRREELYDRPYRAGKNA
jgi:Ribbon-helix-helix protein, copG family